MVRAFAGVVAALLLAACGAPADDTAADPPPQPDGERAVVEVHRGVEFYGACGNNTLELDGTTYYQLYQREIEELDEESYPVPVEEDASGLLPRVAPPGPGDDVGTLVVHDDGIARFESRSGIVWWLTTEKHEYNWVC